MTSCTGMLYTIYNFKHVSDGDHFSFARHLSPLSLYMRCSPARNNSTDCSLFSQCPSCSTMYHSCQFGRAPLMNPSCSHGRRLREDWGGRSPKLLSVGPPIHS